MNVLLLCRKFKKDKSMKKGRFSLLGIVALFLGLILVSCSDPKIRKQSQWQSQLQ